MNREISEQESLSRWTFGPELDVGAAIFAFACCRAGRMSTAALGSPPEGRGPNETVWRAAAACWLQGQGLKPADFAVELSSVQSCPAGCVTVETNFCTADEMERSLRSRVLEIDTATGEVRATLAARDTVAVRALAGSPRPGDSLAVAAVDWQAYRAGKAELDAAIKREGAAFFAAPTKEHATGRVGLLHLYNVVFCRRLLPSV